MPPIRRALLSASDKTGLAEFAKGLVAQGVEILSTGGTFVTLRSAGVLAVEVSHYTGFPEILGGRLKTLHPKVHGGILARRDDPEHRVALEKNEIQWIDLVAVSLYPFERTVSKAETTPEEAIEQIDIGGPALIRAAAKNHEFVTAVVDPADYPPVLEEMKKLGGEVSRETRSRLAAKAFARLSRYDAAIAAYLGRQGAEDQAFPASLLLGGEKVAGLRYGENPHQKAAFYRTGERAEASVAHAKALNGKELSFNNIVDLDAALSLAKEFEKPAAAVVKHANPCGCAVRERVSEALAAAWEGDPRSAFGSVIACNREVDRACAEFLTSSERFVEALIAPSFSKEAFEILTTKPRWGKSVRLLEVGSVGLSSRDSSWIDFRRIYGGFVAQTPDHAAENERDCRVVTKKKPAAGELGDLLFAARVVKRVKSNAIVLAKDGAVVGVGAGQMSRVDSVRLACEKAGARARGSLLASDAFFPFPDGIEAAARAGVAGILQPGGSVKDAEAIAAADKAGISMVFTAIRHFWH